MMMWEFSCLLTGTFFPHQIYEMKEIDFVILLYSFGAALLEVGGQEVDDCF